MPQFSDLTPILEFWKRPQFFGILVLFCIRKRVFRILPLSCARVQKTFHKSLGYTYQLGDWWRDSVLIKLFLLFWRKKCTFFIPSNLLPYRFYFGWGISITPLERTYLHKKCCSQMIFLFFGVHHINRSWGFIHFSKTNQTLFYHFLI